MPATEESVLILWDEQIGTGWKFACVVANMRAAQEGLKAVCTQVYTPTRLERVSNTHDIILIGLAPHGRVAVTRHRVVPPTGPHPEADEATLARQEYDRGAAKRFDWTQDESSGIWYSQAEKDYPDGRYSLVPENDDGTFNIHGYTQPEPLARRLGFHEAVDWVEANG